MARLDQEPSADAVPDLLMTKAAVHSHKPVDGEDTGEAANGGAAQPNNMKILDVEVVQARVHLIRFTLQ